jgi:CRISPR-associated protein Csb3
VGEFVLPGDVRVAVSHLAAYGLAAILEDGGWPGITLHWTRTLDARAVVASATGDADAAAATVLEHARDRASAASWTAATVTVSGATAGRLSPRIKLPANDGEWLDLGRLRRASIDAEIVAGHHLDLRLIGALGEPAYWRFDRSGSRRPDEGASRWEMKTRNRGEDFVQHRLRRLAETVARRPVAAVRDGLFGLRIEDEAGGNAIDSRTATGLANPGPTDNAVAWCALWGLSRLTLVHRLDRPSESAGHWTAHQRGATARWWLCLPVPDRPVTLARLGTLLLSAQLAVGARTGLAGEEADPLTARAGREWLRERGAGAVVRFPVWVSDNASAPERRALLGTVIGLRT